MMLRSFSALSACLMLAAAALPGSAASSGESVPAVEKGKPFPSGPQTIPYEDVLDHCDLVLVGEVKELGQGTLEVAVDSVLKGEYKEKTAKIAFGGSWVTGEVQTIKIPEAGAAGTFMCIRAEGGELILAGDPPKGGGFVEEGAELVKKLLEAARDPAKGYESKDPAVRLSSAYRLMRKWQAAPAEAKPKLPAGVMDVLVQGLLPGDLVGRHVNAGARNCVNDVFQVNINKIWRYSVNDDSGRRETYGKDVIAAWERTVKAVKAKRAGQGDPDAPEKVDPTDAAKRAAALVKQLGHEEYDKREAADRALREMGKDALEALKAGAGSKDVEISERCQAIVEALESAAGLPVNVDKFKFDLELAGKFVAE